MGPRNKSGDDKIERVAVKPSRRWVGSGFRRNDGLGRMRLWGPLSLLGLVLAALAFGIDQTFKWWMLSVFDIAGREPVRVLPIFDLVLAWNHGISYGWLSSHAKAVQWLLTIASLAVSGALWIWLACTVKPLVAAALGLIIGGALGNAIDRMVYGAVADFFHFHWGEFSWYVFNIADIAIVAGVFALLYESVTEKRAT
jgi:signal peptidase II